MSFHLGKPILTMSLLALASGLFVLTRRPAPQTDLTLWVFADDNAKTYREPMPDGQPRLIENFRRRTGNSVAVDLISQRALDVRLISLFMSRPAEALTPDLVEIDLSSIGKFFRPPTDQIGLLPLNGYLAQSGNLKKIPAARLVCWSKDGLIFGVPRDLHPVTLTYRKDLFDQAGVDPATARTWPQFQEQCLQFQKYWSDHGHPERRALELYTTQSEELLLMLLQRHINLVDGHGNIHLSEDRVAQTVAFYAQLVAGPRAIAANTIPGTAFGYRDMADGNVCAMLTPDWRAGYLKDDAPELAGKVAMRSLPVFDETDASTSTWGGTMMGIPRRAKDPDASWKLLEYLCFSPEAIRQRHRYSSVITPVEEYWTDPVYQSSDPFFGGQPIERLYIQLAGEIPARQVTPFSLVAQTGLTLVLHRAIAYVQDHNNDIGLEAACHDWLGQASVEVRQWMNYGELGQ